MEKFKKAWLPVFTFARIDIKRLFRDKMAMFFTFVFPLLFLFIFGGIFGRSGSVSFNVVLINQSNSKVATSFVAEAKKDTILKVNNTLKTIAEADEKMARGEIDATIILPTDFGQIGEKGFPTGQAIVRYNKNSEQAATTLASVLGSMFDSINAQFVSLDKPFTVKTQSNAKQGLTQFDYVFAGLLGFSLMSLGIFGPSNAFPRLKERGVLRRYHTTTLKVWQYFIGNVMSNIVVGLMSVAAMFAVGLTVFHLSMRGSWPLLVALIVVSATMLFGIGLAIGGWAKNERQAAPLTQIVTMPMMFLSGSFFARYLMPLWLQHMTAYLPLTPVIDASRLIITEGKTFVDLLPQFGIIAGWCIIIYFIAFRIFRWE